jgi:hypothetical protein
VTDWYGRWRAREREIYNKYEQGGSGNTGGEQPGTGQSKTVETEVESERQARKNETGRK